MEADESTTLEPHEVVALAHRIALMGAIRKTAAIGFVIFIVLAIYQHNWWLILLSLITAWITALVMSNVSANKVQRLTGMSHESQARAWERYKRDPHFAAIANQAIAERFSRAPN
jgi:hypothetical protein